MVPRSKATSSNVVTSKTVERSVYLHAMDLVRVSSLLLLMVTMVAVPGCVPMGRSRYDSMTIAIASRGVGSGLGSTGMTEFNISSCDARLFLSIRRNSKLSRKDYHYPAPSLQY